MPRRYADIPTGPPSSPDNTGRQKPPRNPGRPPRPNHAHTADKEHKSIKNSKKTICPNAAPRANGKRSNNRPEAAQNTAETAPNR